MFDWYAAEWNFNRPSIDNCDCEGDYNQRLELASKLTPQGLMLEVYKQIKDPIGYSFSDTEYLCQDYAYNLAQYFKQRNWIEGVNIYHAQSEIYIDLRVVTLSGEGHSEVVVEYEGFMWKYDPWKWEPNEYLSVYSEVYEGNTWIRKYGLSKF